MEEATSAPVRARYGRLQLGIGALAAAFAVIAGLVAGGQLDRLDHYALVHWMPGLDPEKARHTVPPVEGVFMPFGLDAPWWNKLLDLVMYPASITISLALFTIGAIVLWRRGARIAAVVWAATWFAANAVEVLVKVAIEKPGLHATKDGVSYHVSSFDHSFPSGHAMRGVLVAGFVGYVWSRSGRLAAAWVGSMTFCLVAASWHVPSDVVGGVIFGLLAVLLAYTAIESLSARGA
jgi:membrane-associated phospholipid phosphatase